MFEQVLELLWDAALTTEEFFWSYIAAPGLIGLGLYLSIKSRFFQIRQFPAIVKIFAGFARQKHTDTTTRGIAPIHAFFAAIGGSIGIGNLVSVGITLQIGGPGAVFWMWFAALLGMLVKYSEIYLGVKFRVQNNENSYTGGPMVYLRHVPHGAFWSTAAAILMCFYGFEIYIFRVVTHAVSVGWNINSFVVIPLLLFLVVGVGQGGVKLVGKICSLVIPAFLMVYIGMGCYVIMQNITIIPSILMTIVKHAFTPHAAVGAFVGNTVLLAVSHGVRRTCYISDIGVGYASTMHAETTESIPAKQASLGVIDIFIDSFIVCTMSIMLILISGVWSQDVDPSFMVSTALAKYFPAVSWIWPLFIFLLGYTTLIAFFTAGRRAAMVLYPKHGAMVYGVLGAGLFLVFSFFGTQNQCLSVMSIIGSLLLLCNLYGLFWLRDYVVFDVKAHEKK